jgi:hypothetical protein
MPDTQPTTAPDLTDPRGTVWRATGQQRNGKELYVIDGKDPATTPRMAMSTKYELEQIFKAEMHPIGAA